MYTLCLSWVRKAAKKYIHTPFYEQFQNKPFSKMVLIQISVISNNTWKDRRSTFLKKYTVKPVYNDHLYNEIYFLWFIQ